MQSLNDLLEFWYLKAIFGAALALLAPVQATIVIIFIMIVLDMITGVLCALKNKRFNSKTLRKSIKKVLMYMTAVLTIRLVEYGVLMSENTLILTQIIGGFLIVTEGVSVLENLTMLGLPLPIGFVNIIFKQIRIIGLEDVFKKSEQAKRELQDIEDILYYQVPTIKSEQIRKLLEVKIKIWIDIARQIYEYFENVQELDNDLIYYKVSSIIQVGIEEIYENWVKENVSACSVDKFTKRHQGRINELMSEIKEVCYRLNNTSNKRKDLIKKITILLYETVLDAQKAESEIVCEYE